MLCDYAWLYARVYVHAIHFLFNTNMMCEATRKKAPKIICVALLRLLCVWMDEFPSVVKAFLQYPTNLPFVCSLSKWWRLEDIYDKCSNFFFFFFFVFSSWNKSVNLQQTHMYKVYVPYWLASVLFRVVMWMDSLVSEYILCTACTTLLHYLSISTLSQPFFQAEFKRNYHTSNWYRQVPRHIRQNPKVSKFYKCWTWWCKLTLNSSMALRLCNSVKHWMHCVL